MAYMRLCCGPDVKFAINIGTPPDTPHKNRAQFFAQQFLGTMVMYGEADAEDAARVEQIIRRSFGMNVTTNSVQLTFHD